VTRGVIRRQYGAAEDIETLPGKNNPSTRRFRAVEKCRPPLAQPVRRNPTAHAIDELTGWYCSEPATFIQSNCRPSLPVLSRAEEGYVPRSSWTARPSLAVLEFFDQAFVRGFGVTDKKQHQNHSHKWDQPGHDHNRIEGVSRSRLSRVRKMAH
jgi:hypothetical protein